MTALLARSLWVIAALAVILRLGPVLAMGQAFPIDYDEGVYLSGAAMLLQGLLPYRDFAFVHPPGVLFALLPFALVAKLASVSVALMAARVAAALIGGVTTYLVGRLVARIGGVGAAVWASAFYATFYEVVAVERGPFIEPLLNLAAILSVGWLHEAATKRSSPVRSAAAAAAMLITKLWALAWIAAMSLAWGIVWLRDRAELRRLAQWVVWTFAIAAVSFGVLALFLRDAPLGEQLLAFHLLRPPDGDPLVATRLHEIFSLRHSLGAVAVLSPLAIRRDRPAAVVCVAMLLVFGALVASFLLGAAYWNQYNAHLALPWAVLAGLGAGELFRLAPSPRERVAIGVACAVAFLPAGRELLFNRPAKQREQLELAAGLEPLGASCIFSFEPGWLFAANRFPPATTPVVLDPYGAMLVAGQRAGPRAESMRTAFDREPAQALMRSRMESCDRVVLGWRGGWQLSEATRAWMHTEWSCRSIAGYETCSRTGRDPRTK